MAVTLRSSQQFIYVTGEEQARPNTAHSMRSLADVATVRTLTAVCFGLKSLVLHACRPLFMLRLVKLYETQNRRP